MTKVVNLIHDHDQSEPNIFTFLYVLVHVGMLNERCEINSVSIYIFKMIYVVMKLKQTICLHNGILLSILPLSPHGFIFVLFLKGLIPIK